VLRRCASPVLVSLRARARCTKHADSGDITMRVRVVGEFMEPFDLGYYPWDCQRLTVRVAFLCRLNGPCPVHIKPISETQGTEGLVDSSRFVFKNVFRLSSTLGLENDVVGAVDEKKKERPNTFPAIAVTAFLHRRAEFHFYNLFCPMAAFLFMSFASLSVPIDEVGDRLELTLTLVLTAAAYKLAVTSVSPEVAYNTLLDYYVLGCGGIMTLLVVVNSIVGGIAAQQVEVVCDAHASHSCGSVSNGLQITDWICHGTLFALAVALQVWLIRNVQHCQAEAGKVMEPEGAEERSRNTDRKYTTSITYNSWFSGRSSSSRKLWEGSRRSALSTSLSRLSAWSRSSKRRGVSSDSAASSSKEIFQRSSGQEQNTNL